MSHPLATLAAPCTHAMEVKKSRFRAQAVPVQDADAAMSWIAAIDDAAAHHSWAWRIGQQYRFNDGGEPSGSAGKPILAAIDGQQLDSVAVVVSRWFGGIKLGVGGLIRAYGGTAAECLRLGERIPIIATTHLTLACSYADLPLIKARMASMQAEVRQEDFGAHTVTVQLALPDEHLDALTRLVADVTHGQGLVAKEET